jgi:hypothetical protein
MKFHEYLAKRDGISLEEAARRSLARTWELAQGEKVMVLITAFDPQFTYEKNVARNTNLMTDIINAKFGFTPLYGYWPYENIDPKTGEKVRTQTREDSFLVSAPEKMPNATLKAIVLGWIQKYQQEAAVIKYIDSDIAYSLHADGTESQLGKWSINRLADMYSQMKYGANAANRSFVFEAADKFSWSTKLAIHAMEKEEEKEMINARKDLRCAL